MSNYFDDLATKVTAGVKQFEDEYARAVDFLNSLSDGSGSGNRIRPYPRPSAVNNDDVRHNLVNDVDEGDCDYCGEDFSDLVKLDPDDLLRELVGITDEESDLYINTYTTELDEVTVVVSDDDDNARIFRVTIEEI